MTSKSTRFQPIVVLAAGVLLGYLAAYGHPPLSRSAHAAADNSTVVVHNAPDASGVGTAGYPAGDKAGILLAQVNPQVTLAQAALGQASGKKPNIVVIWGDDVGQSDISAYSMGLMGFRTANIDRIA